MIFAGLFAIGVLVLLWPAIVLAFRLAKVVVLLAALCGCILIFAVCICGLFGQWCLRQASILARWCRGIPAPASPEPMVAIDVYLGEEDSYADAEDAPTIELPRASFRRLRG
jgi:hypothetical protein